MQQDPERLGREKPIKITEKVQGNYPTSNKKLPRESFVISKVTESQPLFGKCPVREKELPKVENKGAK